MADLASGAVHSLLGVIRNEAQLLRGVGNDVQFIKEEMESMNSFLHHLARTTPPGGEHDEQVRTWMKQVRELAYACSNCIDIYLRHGDPAAVRATRGYLGYLWWATPWYPQKLYARHRAAKQLRELKDRARDVGERRQRYEVHIPTNTSPPPIPGATPPPKTQAAVGGDEGIISGDEAPRAQAFPVPEHLSLLDECTQQLVEWLRYTELHAGQLIHAKDRFPAYVIAAPDEEDGADVASEALAHPLVAEKFQHKFWITSKYRPLDILGHIQQDLLGKLEPQRQDPAQGNILREDQTEENIKEDAQNIIARGRQMLHEKIRRTHENIKEHLLIKEAVEKIKGHMEAKPTLIVLNGHDDVDTWGKIKKALNMLGCANGSAAIVITRNKPEMANKFCNPTSPPILYSLVDFYHNKVCNITNQREKEQDYMVVIYRDILKKCELDEFCMKIFARALYFNPNRNKQELEKLRDTLVFRWQPGWHTNARKMLKFSYSDLSREHKTCLLYLAIFPRDDKIKIRRSSLVGRWVAEGLVTEEDWPSSAHRAEQCFEALIDLCFVYPGDFGAAGKVKSCIVHDVVHEFITDKARKEHFVETRLSHYHARHFSVLSELRIRSSDNIEKFLWKLHESPRLPLVKVLDLEGCYESSKMNQHHLKNICNKMILLKYLSLRNIPISNLPIEINNLHQLEVLDIRQTGVKASTTKKLMLLKLKRLLASTTDPTSTSTDNNNSTMESFNAVRLPRGTEKMIYLQVLSHVEASEDAELEDIGKLWQLKKLGVVIKDKKAHLKKLVRVIGDLSESLQSLSISIKPLQDSNHGAPSNISLRNPLNLLESLSIRGKTSGWLLPLLVKNCNQLDKVTLYNTSLKQVDLKDLGKLPKLRCVRLQHESYTDSNLTFKKKEFLKLKYLLVEGSNLTDIIFEDGTAPELEKIDFSSAGMDNISFGKGAALNLEKNVDLSKTKNTSIKFGDRAAPKLDEIVLSHTNITSITFKEVPKLRKIVSSSTNMEFLSTINNLPGLKEVEFNGRGITSASLNSLVTNANRLAKVILRGTLLKQGDLQILAKLPNMRCLMLLEEFPNMSSQGDEKQLTFNKDEFPKLNLLIVECSDITNISFTNGAAPNLERIVWSFKKMDSLSGISNLTKLKELEFNGDLVPYQVIEDIEAHPNSFFGGFVFKHNKPKKEDTENEADDEGRCPFFWKKKKHRR